MREMKVGRREATLVLRWRDAVRPSEMPSTLGMRFSEIYEWIAAKGIAPEGPPFVIYHAMPVSDEPLDLAVCAPVGRVVEPPDGWALEELPAGSFATAMHIGPYETLGDTYEALKAWIGEHDLAMAGPPREVYLSEPGTPPEQTRTIVEFPVVEAARPVATG